MAAVNKSPDRAYELTLDFDAEGSVKIFTLAGQDTESYNDIGRDEVHIEESSAGDFSRGMKAVLPPHSVSVIQIGTENKEG